MATPQQTIETSLPFRFGTNGAVVMETDPVKQISQHVRVLVATSPGERVMITDYGAGAAGLVFEGGAFAVATQLSLAVRSSLAAWEQGISIQDVTPVLTPDGSGIADVNVSFIRHDDSVSASTILNRAVIEIGGEVTEIVRG